MFYKRQVSLQRFHPYTIHIYTTSGLMFARYSGRPSGSGPPFFKQEHSTTEGCIFQCRLHDQCGYVVMQDASYGNFNLQSKVRVAGNASNRMSRNGRSYRNWLHWKLSIWRFGVQPVTKILPEPGLCFTTATWHCRKNFSQWERSFQRKLRCHWLKGLQQRQIAVVRQGLAGNLHHWRSIATKLPPWRFSVLKIGSVHVRSVFSYLLHFNWKVWCAL